MKKTFSLFKNLDTNLDTLQKIDSCIKITLGPTGKNAISSNKKTELKFLTNGSLLIKALDFNQNSSNVLLNSLKPPE